MILNSTTKKLDFLKNRLAQLDKAAVAFSGGVDSTFLLKVASEVLGSRLLAITASSLVVPKRELEFTKTFTKENGIKHLTFIFDELSLEDFTSNSKDRCYFCKKAIMGKMLLLASQNGIEIILDGSNMDDNHDFRPGARAIKELGIISPLKEAGLTKSEIRSLSKDLNLPTWDKPSNACFASRFPYGEEITREKLIRVADSEEFLTSLGFKQSRVRSHGSIARIELEVSDMETLLNENFRIMIDKKLKELGFTYVSLDLQGYRTGSMNETLNL
ncbi:MAG: ATP-dependent sacrificial sulfur transferase LarE [Eubacteriales bacterium]